ncbi:MAG: type II secretion system F family protein [Pseudomonadota bacterium]
MPVFEYTALKPGGVRASGVMDADSLPAARQKIRSLKMYPVHVRETGKAQPSARGFSLERLTQVGPADVAMLTRQLATLIAAGFPLVAAIDAILVQPGTHRVKKLLSHLKDAIVEGNSFAAALSAAPGSFSPLYINMVRAGEASGSLDIVLERLADILEKQIDLNNRIKTAMAYPALMAVAGAAVLFLLLTYIVPTITGIFREMNAVLPLPTRVLITVSDGLKLYAWVLALAAAGAAALLRGVLKTTWGRRLADRFVLKLPLAGTLIRKLAAARFSRTLGSLLENGVSLMPALGIVRNVVGNTVIVAAVDAAADAVEKGRPLGECLSAADVFPPMAVQMIRVGESSGQLEAMLSKIATVNEREVENYALRMTALLEPVMILAMAVVVGFIVLSVCLPIFEMNQLVK